jgi:hypothetical protein
MLERLLHLPGRLLRFIPGMNSCLGTYLFMPRVECAAHGACTGEMGLAAYAGVDIHDDVANDPRADADINAGIDAESASARENGSRCRATKAVEASRIWMSPVTAVDPNTALFRSEYEQELESWLRRRFRLVCLWYLILGAMVAVLRIFIIGFDEGSGRALAIIANSAAGMASLLTVAWFYFGRTWERATREQLIRTASLMILILGAISLLKGGVVAMATQREENFLLPLFAWHLIACIFLPWTPRESLRPFVPLLAVWMLGVLFIENTSITERVLKMVFAPGILVPGMAWCALQLKYHSERFRMEMVGRQFFSMRREIAEARSIHENLFPKPHDDGFVRFEYTYTPQRELGGDYVHLHASPAGAVYVTLLDVTGHGLAAALTVNRLYGELERIFGESPESEPVEVLSLLNRYIHLTMVKHNIFVTGVCMRLDPNAGRLVWSSAGHPPAFLRGVNGVVTRLPATNVLLGALDGSEFKGRQSEMDLAPGDTILMYTDGAYEARDRQGKMLGLDHIDALAHTQPPPRRWPQFIAAAVQKHTAGRAEDDVLVATMTYIAPRIAQAAESAVAA